MVLIFLTTMELQYLDNWVSTLERSKKYEGCPEKNKQTKKTPAMNAYFFHIAWRDTF